MKKVRGSYLFKVNGNDGTVEQWLVDLKSGSGSVTKSPGLCICRASRWNQCRVVGGESAGELGSAEAENCCSWYWRGGREGGGISPKPVWSGDICHMSVMMVLK